MTDVAKDVRFALARVEAERFYTFPSNPKNNMGIRKSGGGWVGPSRPLIQWLGTPLMLHWT